MVPITFPAPGIRSPQGTSPVEGLPQRDATEDLEVRGPNGGPGGDHLLCQTEKRNGRGIVTPVKTIGKPLENGGL